MKIAVYAIAKNEYENVVGWEASCRDADVRVVTDTGSTDLTSAALESYGVTVAAGCPVPWRWDDAHNLSLMHVPADVDVCIRLDLDERIDPGWREQVEKAFVGNVTKLRYDYHYSAESRWMGDRIHSRHGYRWVGATHEGLIPWAIEEVQATANVVIRHHKAEYAIRESDLPLLRRAVVEAPDDARMAWYLARQLDYQGESDEAISAYLSFLEMPGGSPHERSNACRALARLLPKSAGKYYFRSIYENPKEPEGYLIFARRAWEIGDAVSTLYYARQAAACPVYWQTHASDPVAYGEEPAALASSAAMKLGLLDEALDAAIEAAGRSPENESLANNVEILRSLQTTEGPTL